MKKIQSLFQRNYETDRLVRNEIVPGSEWVPAGEGVATRKFDGTCCMISGGALYRRYDVKAGRQKPLGFIPAQEPDVVTGHWPGWLIVSNGPEDQYHREANHPALPDGTYELVGPKIQGNPEHFNAHTLVRHGESVLPDAPRSFDELREYLRSLNIEGIVWHHPDGRMVKIKRKDFGLSS